jgi:transposase
VSLARGDDAAMSGHRDDLKDDLTEIPARSRRADVIAGLERRRRWSWQEKLKIVAESCADGAIVSRVAKRHGLRPQQLFAWRRQARDDEPPPRHSAPFARVVVEPRPATTVYPGCSAVAAPPGSDAQIEIVLGPTVVRLRGRIDAETLAAVLKALKVTA